jgi:hypothetical protein
MSEPAKFPSEKIWADVCLGVAMIGVNTLVVGSLAIAFVFR